MTKDDSLQREREKRKRVNKRNISLSYIVLIVIVLLLFFICYIIILKAGNLTWKDWVNNIFGSLMGTFVAFLLFDILHNKLSKDSYADDVSEQILETLLEQEGIEALDESLKRKFISAALQSLDSDKKAAKEISVELEKYLNGDADYNQIMQGLALFSEKQKYDFVNSNIESIATDEDVTMMIQNFLNNYLRSNNDCRIRTSFEYKLELRDTLPDAFNQLKHKEEYFFVEETFTYDVKYLSEKMNNVNSDVVSIGFAYDNKSLDKFLRDSQINQVGDPLNNCIFRESLDINHEDVEFLSNLPPTDLKETIRFMFKPHLTIDNFAGEIIEVDAEEYGIVIKFKVGHDTTAMMHTVDIVFDMPKRWHGILEVILLEPTKKPRITLSYSGDVMNVEMYSFLDKGDDTSYENTHIDDIGLYRISLNNTWVYPVSGVVFTIDKK